MSTDVYRLIASWPRHDLREKLDQGPMLAGSPSWKAGEKLALRVGHDASNVFSMSWSNVFQFLFMRWFLGFEHFKLGLGTGKTNNKRWTIPDLTRKQKPTTPSYGFLYWGTDGPGGPEHLLHALHAPVWGQHRTDAKEFRLYLSHLGYWLCPDLRNDKQQESHAVSKPDIAALKVKQLQFENCLRLLVLVMLWSWTPARMFNFILSLSCWMLLDRLEWSLRIKQINQHRPLTQRVFKPSFRWVRAFGGYLFHTQRSRVKPTKKV